MKKILPTALFFCLVNLLSAQETENKNCSPVQMETDDLQFPYDNFFIQRSYPDYGNILPALENAKQIARDQMSSPLRSQNYNLTWQVEGPTNIGGRVNVVAVDSTNTNIMYEGTANGGIFKTTDGGATWASVVDTLSYFAVGDIKIDPTDHNTIYVGLGDPNISGYPAIGNGILKSTDGGATWYNMGLASSRIISKIEIHPLNHNIVYAGAMGLPYAKDNNRGLYKSDNGGQTWRQVLFVSDSAGVIDLILDNTDTNIVYAVTWDRIRQNLYGLIAGQDSKIWKSIDGGSTWAQLTNGLPTGTTFSRIAIAKSATNHNVLYAEFVDSAMLDLFAIYKTTDGGAHWTPINVAAIQGTVMGNFGWYFGNLTVSPYNENSIYVLGVDLWNTTDSGSTWNEVGPPWYTYSLHSDKHCLRFMNPSTILLCTDGGLYQSFDTGTTWSFIDTIPISQFYHVSVDPNLPGNYFGGAQDNGTTAGNGTALSGWPRIYGGDGFQQRFDPTNPDIWYTETQYGVIVYTDDNGFNFYDATTGINPAENHNWDMPYIVSSGNPNTLYTGTTVMYKSTTGYSPYWQPVSSPLINAPIGGDSIFRSISTIDESQMNNNLVYAGTSDGNVWRSVDAGTTWQNITSTLPNRYVTKVKASDVHQNVVFQSNSGYKDNDNIPHIHMSADSGTTWRDISGNLPPFAVNDIEVSHLNDSLIFAATDGGVYYTVNTGATWSRLGSNMPLFQIFDIELDEPGQKLIAATFARSIWSIGVDSILSSFSTLNLSLSANDTICQGNTALLHASGGSGYTWSPAGTLSCSTCPNPIASPVATTVYTVTATNGGASAVDSVVVFVNPAVTVTASQSNDTLYTSQGYTYQWYYNGAIIPGATGYFYVAAASGTYYVVATSQYNCSSQSNTLGIISGIGYINIADAFSIYPNPVNDKITVEKSAAGDWQMSVRDISGRELLNSTIVSAKSEFDLSLYSSGTYFVELTQQGNKLTKKIVKF